MAGSYKIGGKLKPHFSKTKYSEGRQYLVREKQSDTFK
jgi:hypothetical protein